MEKQRLIDDSSDISPELFAIKDEELLSSSSSGLLRPWGPPLLVDTEDGSFLNDLKKAVVDEVGGDDDVGDVGAPSSPLPPP